MDKIIKYITVTLFFCVSIFILFGCADDKESDVFYQPRTELGNTLLEKSSTVARIFSDTCFTVTEGVQETDIHFLKVNGLTTHAYILRIDLKTPGLKLEVSMPYDKDVKKNFTKQTLSEMAEYSDRPDHRVVAMINADFWDISNMDLRGPLHRNGVILKDYFIYKASLYQQALSFAAITKDNKPLIADSGEYRGMKANLKEVTGGGAIVLREGKLASIPASWTQRDPRTVWGYTADDVVYFYVVDGRSALWSNGMTYPELGEIMQALGCRYAVNLDGGGSTQLMIRNPLANVFQIRNRPSDGQERAVINGWMVVVDKP